jgi:biopolymer transport protein ExbD/biopolymer transport protein TolR
MGMGVGPTGSKKLPEPDINVTPLVDVVLVLLIIFMVIAPALEHGERVELPAIFQPDKKQKSKLDPITVTLGASGKLFWEKETVDKEALKRRLLDTKQNDPERRVVLKGDQTLHYVKVREIFALIQDTGFPGVALMVSKRKGAGPDTDSDDES